MTVLGAIVAVVVIVWVVIDPVGAAHMAANVAHQVGVAATWLDHHFSHHKPGLTGVSARFVPDWRPV
jgi:hypothetical protein